MPIGVLLFTTKPNKLLTKFDKFGILELYKSSVKERKIHMENKPNILDLNIEALYNSNKEALYMKFVTYSKEELVSYTEEHGIPYKKYFSEIELAAHLAQEIHAIGVMKRLANPNKGVNIPKQTNSQAQTQAQTQMQKLSPETVKNLDLITTFLQDEPMLTTENGKMYGLYILYPDNTVAEIDATNRLAFDGWYDHCIVPKNFHLLAKDLGINYDNETFAHICKEFVQNHLDWDWTKLHNYLPKEEDGKLKTE